MGPAVHIPIRLQIDLELLLADEASATESVPAAVARALERAGQGLARDGHGGPAVVHPPMIRWHGAEVPDELRRRVEARIGDIIAQAAMPAGATVNAPAPQPRRSQPRPQSKQSQQDDEGLLVLIHGDRMVALPARGLAFRLPRPQELQSEARPFFGIPTVGKEGLRLVNAGGRLGFLLDAGGRPSLLAPQAVGVIQQALGVESLSGIVILHIHEDHIRNLLELIRRHRIRPEGLRFPEAFERSGMRFGRIIAELRATRDRELRELGYGQGRTTPFTTIPVPPAGSTRPTDRVFRHQYTEGNVRVELFGSSEAFAALGRPKNQPGQSKRIKAEDVDRASLVARLTDLESRLSTLVLGDLRGRNLKELYEEMGPQRFREMLAGVRVLEGFQHHMGALTAKDRSGLKLILREILSREGRLDILVQSQARPYGRQTYGFLNRSLIEALRQMGVGVIVAPEAATTNIGAVTVDSQGNIQVTGRNVETFQGDPRIQARLRRYAALNEAIDVLAANRTLLRTSDGGPIDPRLDQLREARQQLGRALGLIGGDGLLQRVLAGVGTGAAHGRSRLTNQAEVEPLVRAALRVHPAERMLEERGFRELVDWLRREGAVHRRAERELRNMRRTGQVSQALIKTLGELDPELARRLLANARLPRDTRKQLEQHLARPAAPAPLRIRAAAGILLAVEVVNQLGPVVESARASSYEHGVSKFLRIILWWQEKGVSPRIQAVQDAWFGSDRESTDPQEISRMLREKEGDYLALTGIDEEAQWDRFNIWMMQHVRNFDDYRIFIEGTRRRDAPLKWEGDWATARWSYRAATIEETFTGYELKETWRRHARLDIIMHAVVQQVIDTTRRDLAMAWEERDPPVEAALYPGDEHVSRPVLEHARVQRRVRFRAGTSDADRRAYAVANEKRVLDGDQYVTEPMFYVIDPRSVVEEIDPEYLLVVGADFNTYALLAQVRSVRIVSMMVNGRQQRRERYRPDNPSGQVLIRASAVEDV